MESVGIRELRQNASALLDRLEATGTSIEITNHGRPVARLVPIARGSGSTRLGLIESGLLKPGRGDLLDIQPVSAPRGTPSSEELLASDRDDR